MTILAVATANIVGAGNHACPDRGGSALRHALELEGRPAGGRILRVDLIDAFLQGVRVFESMAPELGRNAAWMNGRGAHAPFLVAAVEFDCEEDVCSLGTAIGGPRIVRGLFEIGVVEIDIGETMTRRGKLNEPATARDQWGDAVHKDKMAKVIGAELRLETVSGVAKGAGHDASIGDDKIEGLPGLHERIGGSANAGEGAEIEFE